MENPCEVSTESKISESLLRFPGLNSGESKQVYLQVLEEGMEQELMQTVIPFIFR